MSEWQPTETKPRDGAYLVANAKGEVCPCQARAGFLTICNMPGFNDWSYGEPVTNWMPLPSPPATGKE